MSSTVKSSTTVEMYGWFHPQAAEAAVGFALDPRRKGALRVFGWWCWMAEDHRVLCSAGLGNMFNPHEKPGWTPKEWDRDGDPIAYGGWRLGIDHPNPNEYVSAHDADQVFAGCLRRGADVYTAGDDIGCPTTDLKVYPGVNPPHKPIQGAGIPGVIGTCWEPVKQPIAATQLLAAALRSMKRTYSANLSVLSPPREVARDVKGFAMLFDGRLAILYSGGRLEVDGARVEGRVREVSNAGVIFEDGTGSVWWSKDQLLRPLGGLSDPVVELADGCALTSAKEVHCWPSSHGHGTPNAEPLATQPAIFVSRTSTR